MPVDDTDAPSPSPTAAPTRTFKVSASGDPHLVNLYGQRFDLMQPGRHTMLLIPRKAVAHNTLLGVVAVAEQHGGACADMYLMSLNITGRWVGRRHHRGGGHHEQYFADRPVRSESGRISTGWMKYGGVVQLKVVWGRTPQHVRYLNLLVRDLNRAGHHVGGLLGEDDHSRAAQASADCRRSVDI